MYCYQCGAELSEDAKLSRLWTDSGCRATGSRRQASRHGNSCSDSGMAVHWQCRTVRHAWIGAVDRSTILQNLPITPPPDAPFDVIQFVSSIAGLIGTAILLVAAGSAAAGIGLMQYQSWGRILALIMSAVMLIKIPFGTALGIYAFWVLLSQRGREYYDRKSAVADRA